MWLGGVRPLTIMAIVAMAIIPSVAAADDHKKWGDDSEDERTDNRFVVGNWKHRNEGRRGIESPLALFWRRSNLPTVKIAGENLTEPVRKKVNETTEKWGESAGEGVDNRFQIGRLTRNNIADQEKPEDGHDEEQMLELSFHRMSCPLLILQGKIRPNCAALSTSPISRVCGNLSDAPSGCMARCPLSSCRTRNPMSQGNQMQCSTPGTLRITKM